MYIWVKRLHFNISGHANTDAARVTTYIRTTFNHIGITTTTTNATTSFLCSEWFVCAAVVVTGGDCVVFI